MHNSCSHPFLWLPLSRKAMEDASFRYLGTRYALHNNLVCHDRFPEDVVSHRPKACFSREYLVRPGPKLHFLRDGVSPWMQRDKRVSLCAAASHRTLPNGDCDLSHRLWSFSTSFAEAGALPLTIRTREENQRRCNMSSQKVHEAIFYVVIT